MFYLRALNICTDKSKNKKRPLAVEWSIFLLKVEIVYAHAFLGAEHLEVDSDGCAVNDNGHINAVYVAAKCSIVSEKCET